MKAFRKTTKPDKLMTLKRLKLWSLLSTTVLIALPAWAFKVPIHKDNVKAALSGFNVQVDGQAEQFKYWAINEIAEADASVDSHSFFVPHAHFDNEQFHDASERLITLRQRAAEAARQGDGHTARLLLGQALHTLQDFYAHSNWVELGNVTINRNLGIFVLDNPSPNAATCPDNPSVLRTTELTSGYFDLFSIFFGSILGSPCGHIPDGKCAHGGFRCPGINKDDLNIANPSNHLLARRLATEHIRVFVENLIEDLRLSPDSSPIRALLGITSLGFVIDDTASMTNDMTDLKEWVRKVASSPGLAQIRSSWYA